MIKINEKDYDFNNLLGLNFDMLKEVLLNLLENQNNCKIEINNIKDSNDNRDKKISDLENKLTELTKYIKDNEKNNYIIKEIPIQKNFDEKEQNLGSNPNNFEKINDNMLNIEEEIEEEDDKDNIEEEKEDNKIDKTEEEVNDKNDIEEKVEDENKDDKNNLNGEEFNRDDSINIEAKISLIDNTFKDEEIIPKKEEKKVTIDIKQKEEEKKPNKTENKEIIEKEPVKPKKLSAIKAKGKKSIYKTSDDIIDLNKALLQKSQISNEMIRNILHSIKEINGRLNFLEGDLNQKHSESLENARKLLSDHNAQSMTKFNTLRKKIDELFENDEDLQEKFLELEQRLEAISSKNMRPDIIQIFNKDEKDKNEKFMSSTFRESVNKKFELNDNRYMKAEGDNEKLKQNVIVLKGITDKLTRQINLLVKDKENMKANMEQFKKEINEIIDNQNKKLKDEINEKMNPNLEDINNTIDKKLREALDVLMDGNIINNDENNNLNNQINKDNMIDVNNLKADRALIKLLNKRVNELSEKIAQIEESLKNNEKDNNSKAKELEDVKQCMVELYDSLNSKIQKDDLKELYGFYLEHVNEIKFLKTKLSELSEMQEKIRDETPNFIKRLETLTNDISELQESDKKKVFSGKERQIDLSNYINEKKLKNTITPITEEIEKLINENEYNSKLLSDMTDQIKSFEKKEHVDHIENDLNEKITLLNNKCNKRFIEKIEFNKIIKNIDIQIKLLQGNNNRKEEAESWILAKQPIKCFNCATCEANIANSLPPNEYLPWNKYPIGDKQYRIGQGFSKLLKKINKNLEDNNKNDKRNKLLDNSFENESSNKYLINSLNNISDIMKINNRNPNKEDKSSGINNKRYRLPRVIESFKKKQKSIDTVPITDDEKENEEIMMENERENNSPKILNIKKLKNENEEVININPKRNKTGKPSQNKMNRNKSVPLY